MSEPGDVDAIVAMPPRLQWVPDAARAQVFLLVLQLLHAADNGAPDPREHYAVLVLAPSAVARYARETEASGLIERALASAASHNGAAVVLVTVADAAAILDLAPDAPAWGGLARPSEASMRGVALWGHGGRDDDLRAVGFWIELSAPVVH